MAKHLNQYMGKGYDFYFPGGVMLADLWCLLSFDLCFVPENKNWNVCIYKHINIYHGNPQPSFLVFFYPYSYGLKWVVGVQKYMYRNYPRSQPPF